MLNNNIFKLFFDYRGTLGSKEYKAGLVFLFMLFILRLFNYHLYTISFNTFFKLSNDYSLIDISLINGIMDHLFYFSIPFSIITLYCCIVITSKRSRFLKKREYIGILSGILLYFLFDFIFFFISNNDYDIKSSIIQFKTFWRFLFFLMVFVIILSIISIIKFSKKTENENDYLGTKNNTINTLIYIGRIILGIFLIFVTISIFIFINDDLKLIQNFQISDNIIYLIGVIGFIFFICILDKRASDAGVKSNKIFILLFCSFILFFIVIVITPLYDTLFYKQPFVYKVLCIVLYYINIIAILGIFNLIGLPTKQEKKDL